jgi:hypothetical protein
MASTKWVSVNRDADFPYGSGASSRGGYSGSAFGTVLFHFLVFAFCVRHGLRL